VAVEDLFNGLKDIQGGFEVLYCIVDQGRQRSRGFSRDKIRGVSMPVCPLQSIFFLSQTPDQPGQVSFKGGLPLI
jgi:hypothetical protein